MKRYIQGLSMLVVAFFSIFSLTFVWSEVTGEPVQAAVIEESVDSSCANSVLGLRPWYRGVVTRDSSGSCTIGKIAQDENGNTKLAGFVWVIILNLMYDASLVSSIVATGFIIWGGYKYIMSEGDPSRVMTGKKIITGAVIGLVLTISASVISDTLVNVISGVAK
jgi:hypothetical protein